MAADLGTAFLRVSPDVTGLNAQLVGYFSSSKFKNLGKAAGVALGAGLAAGGAVKGLYEVGQAFDEAYDKIRVGTGATGKNLKGLEKDFKSVVSAVPADFGDAGDAIADLNTRLGLTGKPLRKLSEQMLELSRITETDVGSNIQSVTRLFGDWSIKTGKQAETLDKLFRASQATGIEVATLSDLMVQFGSPLRQLGLDFDTAAAMFSRFEKEGVNIQTLMPGLRMALKNFSDPTDDLSKTLEKLGVSLKDGPAAALQDVFAALEKAPSDLKANALAFEVFGARAGPDMAAAVREGRFELDDLMKTIDKGKDTVKKAGRQTMDFGEQWTRLKNNVFVALEPVASKVFGELGDEMKRVTDILTDKHLSSEEKFTAIMDEIQHAAEKWGPKIAEAGGKIGLALVKGIAGAFLHSDILGKLFIGAAAFKLFGGAAVFDGLGTKIATRVGTSMKSRLGAMGPTIFGAVLTAGLIGLTEDNKIDAATEKINKVIDRYQERVDDLTGDLKFRYGSMAAAAAAMSKRQQKAYKEAAKVAVERGDITMTEYQHLMETFDKAADRQEKSWKRAAKVTGQKTSEIKNDVGDMTVKVSKSYDNMVEISGGGIDWLMKNTSKAMQALGLKQELKWSLERHKTGPTGGGYGNQSRQRGGEIYPVPGVGTGDKVPAMLEPGEVVVNREAVKAMGGPHRVNRINDLIPRFQKGGTVGGATGGLHPAILQLVTQLYQKFGGTVSSGLRAGDSDSLHSTGQAADYVPSNWPGAAAAANRIGGSLLEGIYNPQVHGGPAVSWDSGSRVSPGFWGGSTWAGHMDHIHLAIADGTKAALGAAVDNIKRVLLKGPDGPLKDMGQAALDKVRDAANDFLASKMPPIGAGKMHGPIKGLPDALQKYNRVYPQSSGFGDGYAMPFNAVAALGEWAGAPGVSMARTAIGESQLEPGAVGFDPGGTRGLGLWMITTGYNDGLINKLGGESAMRNPVINAQAMNSIFQSQGIGAWYSRTADSSNTHYNGPLLHQRGGIIGFAKGGKVLHGAVHGGQTDPAWRRFEKARKVAQRLKDLLGEKGRIARIDERIGLAETMAGLDSSPMGSDLSEGERARQIALNERLLSSLVMARKLAKTGVGYTMLHGLGTDKDTEKRLRTLRGGFNSYLTDLTGITGKGGRIFDTKVQLDTLRNATLGSGATSAIDISGLRSVIEAARYGVFDGFRANGGSIAPGKWAITGERGPEIVRGPASVTPMGGPINLEVNFDWQGMDLYVEAKAEGQILKREKVRDGKVRQYA